MGAAARKRGDKLISQQITDALKISMPEGIDWQAVVQNRDLRLAEKDAELQEAKNYLRIALQDLADTQAKFANEQEIAARLRCDVEAMRRNYEAVNANWQRCSQMIRDNMTPEQVEMWRQENPRKEASK